MIDAATGLIELPGLSQALRPRMDEQRVSELVAPQGATPSSLPGGHTWFRFTVMRNQKPVCVALRCTGGILRTVELYFSNYAAGATWDNWSEANEMAIKALHDAYLHETLGDPPYSFAWGDAASEYDPRGGFSSILITYR